MKTQNLEERKEELLEFYKRVSPKQYEFTKNFYEEADDEELDNFFEGIIEKGIPVHQGPFFDNINIYDLSDLYDYYGEKLGVKPFKFEGIENPICMGEMYFLRLKHDPTNKSSLRSTNFNDLKDLPAKDKQFKEFKSLYPRTPIKFGEMEVANAMISNDIDSVKEFLDTYANNIEARDALDYELLTGNPFYTDFELDRNKIGKSNTGKILEEWLYSLGIGLVETEEE